MSNLIEILNTINSNLKNFSKPKNSEDFILKLLNESDIKDAIELLKSLKLPADKIKEIISKLPPEKSKKISFQFLEKNIINLNTQLTPSQTPSIKEIKNQILNNNQTKEIKTIKQISNNFTIQHLKISESISPITKKIKKTENSKSISSKTEILHFILNKDFLAKNKKIKKEIKELKDLTETIKIIKKDNFPQKVIKEIKSSKDFKKLITIANKNGLNIKKIITKTLKTPSKKEKLPTSKILLTQKPTIHKEFKIKTTSVNQKTKKNNIFQILLSSSKTNKKPIKKENNNDNSIKFPKLNIHHNIEIEIKHKIIEAKESIRHFSNNLKEAIENYKPPISKLSIELHPKELGKVEVTLIHRGDNLQININSNNQAINFFHTHQTELKNTLVNMGYSGIDMNFNSNQNKENQEKKTYKQYSSNKNDENYDELIIEIPYTYA